MKTQYFKVNKDRKKGLVLSSPNIDWSKLDKNQASIQWRYCLQSMWHSEKEGDISKELLIEHFYKFLESVYKKEDIDHIKRVKDVYIPFTLLSVSYMLSIGAVYDDGIKYFSENVNNLIKRGKKVLLEKEEVVRVDRSRENYLRVLGEIQELEDDIFNVNISDWLEKKAIGKDIAERLSLFYAGRLEEVFQIRDGKDEQLNEAYSKFSKAQKDYMVKWYMNLIKGLDISKNEAVQGQMATRKSRPKTPDKIVKKLKYMSTCSELGLKSISPEKIVGSTVLWAYNVKLRKLINYVSKEGNKLSVEGTTIINFDELASTSKTLRKPELQIKEFMNGGKIHMREYYKSIKSVGSNLSGRISTDIILLKAF